MVENKIKAHQNVFRTYSILFFLPPLTEFSGSAHGRCLLCSFQTYNAAITQTARLEAVSYSNYIPLSENIYQVCLHLNYTSEQ